ncbi:M43 family zinc metalloprotease [Marinigracilibium pacificum]|uniref:T9SS type A sorting domain-containing protein n=1 Tax=Marinigracilibium pacificum TaxID=2729599 RepID=A0A848J0Q4_9BACT|nr:M43 family zinc metalloprotease [Marinigracilibium pacificum]NMM50373.1 T9SS type A sorting domain-containing protein [Marinigracilibium pacificum]
MMNIYRLVPVMFLCMISGLNNIYSQNTDLNCRSSEQNKIILQQSSEAQAEYLMHEKFTSDFVENLKKLRNNSTSQASAYIIPVVFHVFGTSFSGQTVTQSKIEQALSVLNEEFQGLNDDFNSVDARFDGVKQFMNIEFRLAQIDPDGNSTSGVMFYGVQNGFGNGSGYDAKIRQYAWDNYKYMNVYIQSDLYNDGGTTNSGVAWYPNTQMSNKNTARVVYNGRYLYGNTDPEFASVLTHEFGHWLNLIHTFEGGCSYPNDQVTDTPPENSSISDNCNPATNCEGNYINHENYMGYNGADGCYKMFTQGQVNRMLAALEHPARKPLWQESNLIATGTSDVGSITVEAPSSLVASAVSSSKIDLTWNDNSNNEEGFSIEQSVNGGSYSQIATVGANTTNYSNTNLAAFTQYSYRVRAYAGSTNSSYSNVASATTLEDSNTYCDISGNTKYEFIKNVSIGSFSYSSSASSSGYEDNTAKVITLSPGANTSVSLSPGFAGRSYTEYWSIWIDYNNNNTFESSERVVSGLSGTGDVNGSFTVDSNASGTARMRIVMKYNSTPSSACGEIGDGEAEDYTVDFSGSGNPDPTVLPAPANVRSAGTYSSGFYAGWDLVDGATSYEVQLFNGTWENEGTSTTYYFWIPKQGNITSYTFRVRARNSEGVSEWSNEFTVNLPVAGPMTSSFNFYPNPSDGQIQFYIPKDRGDFTVEVYNSTGKMVDEVSNQFHYSTQHLTSGIYLLRLRGDGESATKRLIVK